MDFKLNPEDILDLGSYLSARESHIAKAAQRKLMEFLADRMCHYPEGDLFVTKGNEWVFSGHYYKDSYCINSTIWQELRKGVGLE